MQPHRRSSSAATRSTGWVPPPHPHQANMGVARLLPASSPRAHQCPSLPGHPVGPPFHPPPAHITSKLYSSSPQPLHLRFPPPHRLPYQVSLSVFLMTQFFSNSRDASRRGMITNLSIGIMGILILWYILHWTEHQHTSRQAKKVFKCMEMLEVAKMLHVCPALPHRRVTYQQHLCYSCLSASHVCQPWPSLPLFVVSLWHLLVRLYCFFSLSQPDGEKF